MTILALLLAWLIVPFIPFLLIGLRRQRLQQRADKRADGPEILNATDTHGERI